MFSKSVLDDISPEPLPLTTYRFKVTEDADAKSIATRLDSSFFENGLETSVLEEDLAEAREQNLGINRLLQGFMASGLLVGIAALGVISLRAVVERRQQIGVLRAIGYRRGMVLASFLMESSFIALLGILLGVGLGSLLSYNLVAEIGEDIPGLKFAVPMGSDRLDRRHSLRLLVADDVPARAAGVSHIPRRSVAVRVARHVEHSRTRQGAEGFAAWTRLRSCLSLFPDRRLTTGGQDHARTRPCPGGQLRVGR